MPSQFIQPLQDPGLSPVNALPEGLLDMLGVNNLGQYPNALSRAIQGQLDLLPLLMAQRTVQLLEAGPLTLTGVGATLCTTTVPANEIWYVRAYAWVGTLTAGMTATIRVWSSPYPLVAANSVDDSDVDGGATGTVGARIRAVKRNFWATSGQGFGATAIVNTGGPLNVFSALWNYVPFKR